MSMRNAKLVALCRYRFRRTLGGRAGWAAALAVMVVAVAMGVAIYDQHPHAQASGIVQGAARWLAWLAAGPLALSIAAGPVERDRSDGVESLVLLRGGSRRQLAGARVVAATIEAALRLGLPAVGICLLLATWAPSHACELLSLAVAVGLFAAVAGAVIGIVAAWCGHYGGPRGRGLLALVVLIPWVLADLVGQPGWCLPGALEALLTVLSRLALHLCAGGAA